jgi:predicted type IV restriction endonuclease
MDDEPFLIFDFENIKENAVNELCKFHKSSFDIEKITDTASLLKYSTAFKQIFENEINNPSEEFVKHFARQIYNGRLTEKVVEQFTEIIKKSINQSFKEVVNDRLQYALKKEEETKPETEIETPEENEIITTDEEIECFYIVKSILHDAVNISRIFARDTKSYFGVILDDNNRKPICRLHLNGTNKYLGLFDKNKSEKKILIKSLDDIYKYADQIKDTLKYY